MAMLGQFWGVSRNFWWHDAVYHEADQCMKRPYFANVRIFWSRSAEGAVVLWGTRKSKYHCMFQQNWYLELAKFMAHFMYHDFACNKWFKLLTIKCTIKTVIPGILCRFVKQRQSLNNSKLCCRLWSTYCLWYSRWVQQFFCVYCLQLLTKFYADTKYHHAMKSRAITIISCKFW